MADRKGEQRTHPKWGVCTAMRLPFIWVLLGLFIGPAIMAALILLWREWAAEGAR